MSASTETPTARRSRQLYALRTTSADIADTLTNAEQRDAHKPLGQKERAQIKKKVETQLRTLHSLLEGMLS